MNWKKNDHIVCVDDSLPFSADHNGILKLGRVYKILDIQLFPNIGTIVLKIQDINTKAIDWHNANKFTVLQKEV